MADVLCPVLVGRHDEQALLRRAWHEAEQGRGGVVTIVGEAGVGKSRLVRELAQHAIEAGATVVLGRATPTGAGTPFRPWTEALVQALRVVGLPSDSDLAPWLPGLAAIVPVVIVGAHGVGDESATVRSEAVVRLLQHLSRDEPMLVVLEDLQWADPESLEVADYLADNLAGMAVLCVVTIRSEPASAALELVSRLRGRVGSATIALARLDDDEVGVMVRACMPDAPDALVARVRSAAEGVPLLVEEVLASPGVPHTMAEAVRSRLAALGPDQRGVIETAAVLGRHFDWRLLGPATGQDDDDVSAALEAGVRSVLLAVDAGAFQFRHALIRDAVVELLLPTRQSALAAAALRAIDAAHPVLDGPARDLAADVAGQAGQWSRAGSLHLAAGQAALERGALETAVMRLRRAASLLDSGPEWANAEAALVQALALAGRVDEATATGDELLDRLAVAGAPAEARADIELELARAAVAAAQWGRAERRLVAAEQLLAGTPAGSRAARAGLLRAEVAVGMDDFDQGRRIAEAVLDVPDLEADVRCHALELVGRSERIRDLDQARQWFEVALATATAARLPMARLRALHELGTIEMFDHAGTDRLLEARRVAGELGALSTGAIIDVHLAAALMFRFELPAAMDRARAATALGKALGLARTEALGQMFMAECNAMTGDRDEMERHIALAGSMAPGDPDIEGSAWAGARGMFLVFAGDRDGALVALDRGVGIMRPLQGSGPAIYRGLYALLLAVVGDGRAASAIDEARRAGVAVNRANRGFFGWAEAVLAGQRGDRVHAASLAADAEAELVHYPVWADLARLHVASAAAADGWADPSKWLAAARDAFTARGFGVLAGQCDALLAGPDHRHWTHLGVTAREADVLALVAEGLTNKEIAAALYVSPRTVEKHVESLLRKLKARSRTQLVALATRSTLG